MVARLAEEGDAVLRPIPAPGLADVAVLTLGPSGLVSSWSVTAARLFGHAAEEVAGRHACDVLLTGPGQRELLASALAETAAGRVWIATLAVSSAAGSVRVTLHCEPLAGPGSEVLMIARLASPKADRNVLTKASTMIGTTLDLDQTAREVTEVAVPAFADGAAIFVSERLLVADEIVPQPVGPAVVMRMLAARVADQPGSVPGDLLRPGEVLVFGADSPSYRAIATREPVVFDDLDGETARRITRRPGGEKISSGYASFLTVPLVAGEVVLGCATFGRTSAWNAFGPADLAVAGELARRAAVSIDNARLYDRERRTATALQRGLLPSAPSTPDGLAVAHRYLPVGASVVGGDWHDIIPLPGGRAALIVGDAMGHGPEAAAVMVQLRTAAHTLAELELRPEEILGRLDAMATRMPAATFATCIAAVIDPAASTCQVAKAGHLPPVLVYGDGTASIVDLPPGLPLGLGIGSFRSAQVGLPPGATLALYTDGLVESRSRPLDDGLTALCDALGTALARPGGTLDDHCQGVTRALRQAGEDDITLVLARILPADGR